MVVWYLILAVGGYTLTVLPHEFASLATCTVSAESFRDSPGAPVVPRRSAYCLPALVGTADDPQ